MMRGAINGAKRPTQEQVVRDLIASAPPRTWRLIKPRKPRGYWTPGGIGAEKIISLAKKGLRPAQIARRLGQKYGNIYKIGLSLRCWTEVKRASAPIPAAMMGKQPQVIEWDDAPIFKMYGHAGGYGSVPEHVSRWPYPI